MTEFERFARHSNNNGIRMVLTLNPPLPRLRLERQMESGEDCLSAESTSSAAAQMRR
jgi:hypothetical protein